MKFLIVDDDPASRAVLTRILAANPEDQTTVADSGIAGWRILDDPGRSFDIAFLDLMMEEPDGFELLRRIRTSPLLRSLAVVLCTASNDRATVIKAAQLGARHYIVKPCTAEIVTPKVQLIRESHAPFAERRLAKV